MTPYGNGIRNICFCFGVRVVNHLSKVLLGVGWSCFRAEVILHEYSEEILSVML